MTWLLLVAAVCSVARTDAGVIARSRQNVRAFHREHPCPAGPDAGSKTRCRGYVVDHIVPLCAGGHDGADNYQWQELVASRAKDRSEVALCRWVEKACGRDR
jgi:hypothetical protein